jgi:hypothetical protein
MEDPQGRKRSRPTTPTMSGGVGTAPPDDAVHEEPRGTSSAEHERRQVKLCQQLRDPVQRNAALNDLLQTTASHEINFALADDSILQELSKIVLADCLHWKHDDGAEEDREEENPVFRSKQAWLRPPTAKMAAFAEHCVGKLGGTPSRNKISAEQQKTVEVIAVILRNLSFVGGNLRLMAYSPDVVLSLIACLYCAEGRDAQHPVALTALQTLHNLTRLFDVTGQQLLCDKLFYDPSQQPDGPMVPNPEKYGKDVPSWGFGGCLLARGLDAREDTVANVPKDFLLSLCQDHLVSVWSLFPALKTVLLDCSSPRPVLLAALDVLQELISQARVGLIGVLQDEDDLEDKLPSLRAILVHMPDSVLERLIDLLYVPRLGSDALEYVDPAHHIVTRVTTLFLLRGYDHTVDTDARDRVLEVLVPLQELDSPRIAARLGRDSSGALRTRLFDALVPCLTTQAGRNEASVLASQMFRELNKAGGNKAGFLYVQDRLVELASRDPRVSQLVWNHLYLLPEEEVEEADEEEAESESGQGLSSSSHSRRSKTESEA